MLNFTWTKIHKKLIHTHEMPILIWFLFKKEEKEIPSKKEAKGLCVL